MAILRVGKKKHKETGFDAPDMIDLNDGYESPKKKAKRERNREYAVVTYFFLFLFVALIGYFGWILFARAETIINSSYNKRSEIYAQRVQRGSILSSDGEVLAYSKEDDDGGEDRIYPYGEVFAHAVGYDIKGGAGLEDEANFYLLRSHTFITSYLANEVTGNKNIGDNVITTLDAGVQEAAYEAIGDYRGAVVVIQPSTGKIIAMASKPSFDPNTLESDWDDIVGDDEGDSPLLNRASQGLYPPGSTFKIFAALEYFNEKSTGESFSYYCTSSITKGDSTIHCYANASHGELSLKKAFAKSCNCAFASLGYEIDLPSYRKLVEKALFNDTLPVSFAYSKSSFSMPDDPSDEELMQTVIGQGNTLVTPLHMALVVSAIDNKGVLRYPYMIDKIESSSGGEVETFEQKDKKRLFSKKSSKTLREYMRYTVTDGTAKDLNVSSYKAYGKTGSAEYSDTLDLTHSWFVGFAKKDGYEDIAIAVIVEKSGSGSKYAVPVAKKVFDEYFSK